MTSWFKLPLATALAAGLSLAAVAAHAETTVRFTIAEYSSKTGPFFEEVKAAFEKENPDVTVQLEVVPWDNLRQKLDTDIAAGANADLAIIGTRWLIDFAKADIVEPLDALVNDEFKGRFFDPILAPSIMDGKLLGLPVAASARAMYYNRDLFQRAGLGGPPTTWDEVKASAQKIVALGGDVAGFGMQGKEIETDVYFYYALWAYGGDILVEGKSGLASEAAVTAATLYKEMIDAGLTQKGVTGYNREDVQNLFKKGQVGMMITAPFLANQIRAEAPNLNYGVTPVPAGTVSGTYGVTDSIIMFKNSKNKEAAAKFLEFAFRPEWREKFDAGEGFLPVTEAVAAMPAFANDPVLQIFSGALANARFAPVIPGWEEIAQTTGDGLQRIYLGQGEPKAVLEETAAKVNEILARNQ
jgi:multiple sugar transport system substrate-binding protein